MDYEQLRGSLDNALAELEYLSIGEELVELNETLRCTAGGYGDVYKATLRGPARVANRVVAVKELRRVGDDATRIRLAIHLARELRVWAKLKHPNVLELIGYSLNPQMTTARFISPFMTNGNIEEYLANAPGPVTDALRLKLLKGSLNGLVYLHSLDPPVCHADIKPENVLVTDSIEAVLCDFGLARPADGQPSGLTTTRTIKGSTRYMSPELLEEDAFHTLSSDVWAYGCLFFKVMTCSLPYASARSDQQIILALALKKTPMELADLDLGDDQLTTLLTKCWDINPSTRPSAAECLPYLPNTETKEPQFPETVDDSVSAFTDDENYRKRTTSTAATIRQSSANWSADPTIVRRFAQYREASSTPVGRLKLVLSGHPSVGPASDAEEQAGLVEALLSATSRVPQRPQTRVPQDHTPTPRPALQIATSNGASIGAPSLPSRPAAPRRDEDASTTPGASDSEPGSLAAVQAANRDLAALIISWGYASKPRKNSRRSGSVEPEFNLSVILDDDSQDEQL